MTIRNYTRKDDATRKAVLNLLRKGLASISEAAEASGISRQLIHHWLEGMSWQEARKRRVEQEWKKELNK